MKKTAVFPDGYGRIGKYHTGGYDRIGAYPTGGYGRIGVFMV